jgi:hypothetical protein
LFEKEFLRMELPCSWSKVDHHSHTFASSPESPTTIAVSLLPAPDAVTAACGDCAFAGGGETAVVVIIVTAADAAAAAYAAAFVGGVVAAAELMLPPHIAATATAAAAAVWSCCRRCWRWCCQMSLLLLLLLLPPPLPLPPRTSAAKTDLDSIRYQFFILVSRFGA